jgi:hypothetical protein
VIPFGDFLLFLKTERTTRHVRFCSPRHGRASSNFLTRRSTESNIASFVAQDHAMTFQVASIIARELFGRPFAVLR